MLRRPLSTALVALGVLAPLSAHAEAQADRFGAGGYLRIGTRPDFQGGNSRLGYWNLYGRLLNEGQWAALEMKLDLLQREANSDKPWTSLHAKIEGDSILTADPAKGVLSAYRNTQLYVQAGNILLKDVTWQVGTLDTYYGNLGLYDMRPAQLLYETVGVSARYQKKDVDFLVGGGDSGYFMRGPQYNTIFTGAAALKVRLANGHAELGFGGQLGYEPKVVGNRYAPYATQDVAYEDFFRHEVVQRWAEKNPDKLDYFPNPVPTSSLSWKGIAYLGFGNLGPLKWSNFFGNVQRLHPDQFYTESYAGKNYEIYTHDLTDQRYQINAGNEALFTIIPGKLDLVWGLLYGYYWDVDNKDVPSDNNRVFYSTVVRLQHYVTDTVHLLAETSLAHEESLNGNMYRNHADSVFQSTSGRNDPRGLEYGDSRTRDTWQGKIGPVFSPFGTGIWARPSLRLLYGAQYSTQNNAFGNSFVDSLDQNNIFKTEERHWHHVVAVEAEAWF